MSRFEADSHIQTPEDPYVKEVVTLKFNLPGLDFYVPYFRKATKDGKLFWSTATGGFQHDGVKKYVDGFELDSLSLQKKIKTFLDERQFEKKQPQASMVYPHGLIKPIEQVPEFPPLSMDEVQANDAIPF